MNTESNTARRKRFENSVIAALETTANRLAHANGHPPKANGHGGRADDIDRTVAIVEAASAKIDEGDFADIGALCAGQALALGVIFQQLAKDAARGDLLFHPHIRMALKAQSQCRATVKCLMSLKPPRQTGPA